MHQQNAPIHQHNMLHQSFQNQQFHNSFPHQNSILQTSQHQPLTRPEIQHQMSYQQSFNKYHSMEQNNSAQQFNNSMQKQPFQHHDSLHHTSIQQNSFHPQYQNTSINQPVHSQQTIQQNIYPQQNLQNEHSLQQLHLHQNPMNQYQENDMSHPQIFVDALNSSMNLQRPMHLKRSVQHAELQNENIFHNEQNQSMHNLYQQPIQQPNIQIRSGTPHKNSFQDINKDAWQRHSNLVSSSVNPESLTPHYEQNNDFKDELSALWSDQTDEIYKPAITKFTLYEESNVGLQKQIQPKGSAMKTPFQDINHDEIVETGSRGGLDVGAAQPMDSAKRLEEDSPPEDAVLGFADLSTNTAVFNFNLNAMKVSTPVHKQFGALQNGSGDVVRSSRKQLFNEPEKVLSVIFEETKGQVFFSK